MKYLQFDMFTRVELKAVSHVHQLQCLQSSISSNT
jgi:hypothetical protein